MAGRWWRYNPTSHIFEQSLDEGTSWTKPPLHASIITEGVFDPARLGGSVAYTNVDNLFSTHQTFTGGSGTSIHSSPIELIMASYPRIGFHWPGVIASSIGMDASGQLRTFNNPGTGYETFICGRLYTAEYIYPGAITNPNVVQSAWYLSSHSSFGLYTNTGLYAAGGLWSATNVYAAHTILTGNLTVGSCVAFPSVQVQGPHSNCLDDYEEGGWTPILYGNGGVQPGYAVQAGLYVRVGAIVHITGRLITSTAGLTGVLYVGSLPFLNWNYTGHNYCPAPIGHWAGLTVNYAYLIGLLAPNNTVFDIRGTAGAVSATQQLIGQQVGASFDIIFQTTYMCWT